MMMRKDEGGIVITGCELCPCQFCSSQELLEMALLCNGAEVKPAPFAAVTEVGRV